MQDSTESRPKDTEAVIDRILELFRDRGGDRYGGEDISQTEHALQAAWAAEKEGATPELISAALLHDLGHLLHNLPDDCADHGVDDQHEELACRWLQRYFGLSVTEPIRMHVAAKRYLCATEPGYHDALSDASRTSLRLQGGPFSERETESFRQIPFAQDALRLRHWDDIAKIVGLQTPALDHYRSHLLQAAGLA